MLCEALLGVAQPCVVDKDVERPLTLVDGRGKSLDAVLLRQVQWGPALHLGALVLGPAYADNKNKKAPLGMGRLSRYPFISKVQWGLALHLGALVLGPVCLISGQEQHRCGTQSSRVARAPLLNQKCLLD